MKSKWTSLNHKDIDVLHRHYLKYDPYANLNIVDMWGYMGTDARWIKTGDTIAYEMTDYFSGEKSYTLLGEDSVRDGIRHIIDANNQKGHLTLKAVPEPTYKSLLGWDALVDSGEDHDNHDYIFKLDSLVGFSSTKLRKKKSSLTRLLRLHPNISVRVINHNDSKSRQKIYRLFRSWVENKHAEDWSREYAALKRTLNIKTFPIVCIGAFDGKKLIGFTVNEPEKHGYYQGHFGKINYSYKGLGLLMEHETAKIMKEKYGSKYVNLQQDLGIEGLRYYKTSLGPCKKLKKYRLVLDPSKV